MSHGINAYKSVGLETGVQAASPVKLVIMLYDGAIDSCRKAAIAIGSGDFSMKSRMLNRAIGIINAGLLQKLDIENGGEVAKNLADLYGYMIDGLMDVNINNETAKLDEVANLLSEIRTSWISIEKEVVEVAAA